MSLFNYSFGGQSFQTSSNFFALNPSFGNVQVPIISPLVTLSPQQNLFVGSVLVSDRLNIGLSNSSDIINFNGGYLNGSDSFKFQPNFNNPSLSVGYFGKLAGIDSTTLNLLLEEANKKKGDKTWLKNFIAFLGKNWAAILSGVITAGTLIQQSKNSQLGTQIGNTGPDVYIPTNTPEVPTPYTSGGTGDIQSFISSNLLPIGLVVGAYFLLRK